MERIVRLKRVVVTGLGAITPLGLDVPVTWQEMLKGKSGIDIIKKWGDLAELKQKHNLPDDFPFVAGEVKDFDIRQIVQQRKTGCDKEDLKQIKWMDEFIQFAYAATLEAVVDSGIDLSKENLNQIGVIIGPGIGGVQTWEAEVKRFFEGKKISPLFIPRLIPNLAAGNISISFKTKGVNLCSSAACATGSHNIGLAFRRIQLGEEDAIACGGTEAAITPFNVYGFHSMKALATRYQSPQSASCPFDEEHNGFVMAEGAGVLILEELEHALRRGAKIYAELIGYATTGDAKHITHPDVEGAINCMSRVLSDAMIEPDQIDLINAHGTSTDVGDPNEAQAVKEVFRGNEKLLITANKSQIGHTLGAAGGIEGVFTVLSVFYDIVPPILNLNKVDQKCEGLNYVRGEAKRQKINLALSNSFGFGGTNACLIFSKFIN